MVLPEVQKTKLMMDPYNNGDLVEFDSSSESQTDDGSGSDDNSIEDSHALQTIQFAYTGHVKSLVKMYEKFGTSVSTAGKVAKPKPLQSLPTKSVEDQRLAVLEKRMNAVIRFISDFVETELDVLESNAKIQVEIDSKVSVQQNRANELDEEMDEIMSHLPHFEHLIGNLNKQNKLLSMRVSKIEGTLGEFHNLHKDVLAITDMVSMLLIQVGGLVKAEKARKSSAKEKQYSSS